MEGLRDRCIIFTNKRSNSHLPLILLQHREIDFESSESLLNGPILWRLSRLQGIHMLVAPVGPRKEQGYIDCGLVLPSVLPSSSMPETKPTTKETCLTLLVEADSDVQIRCLKVPTHGSPPLRCQIHHGQYCKMTKAYKDASHIVDEMDDAVIPTKLEVAHYDDAYATVKKAGWMRRYVEAIRVEKIGREIHHARFFLKVDKGHKIRMNLLKKKMVQAVDVMDALQSHAFHLQHQKDPSYEWIKPLQSQSSPVSNGSADPNSDPMSFLDVLRKSGTSQSVVRVGAYETEDDDLIDMALRAEHLRIYGYLRQDQQEFLESLPEKKRKDAEYVRCENIRRDTILQYTRRILLYDEVLAQKASGKVSLHDLLLDRNFSDEDFERLETGHSKGPGLGLLWWKDAVLEAIAMWPKAGKPDTAANVGSPENRFPMIGGWVFNRRHKRTMTNEGWWYLLEVLKPPKNIENRLMRLCNNFDDMHALFSFGALGFIPPPDFCSPNHVERSLLSLCGVIVGDIVGEGGISGPIPTTKPASRPGQIQWVEMENRIFMFGAIRNERDTFADSFMAELRSRPDLFLVITRSDTDPGQEIEQFGGVEGDTPSAMRFRTFEAPWASFEDRPQRRGIWEDCLTMRDLLYETGLSRTPSFPVPIPTIKGYLRLLHPGWLFYLKQFPVKYFVIVDAVPNRSRFDLTRNVAWAAMRAYSVATRTAIAEGSVTTEKFIEASDKLVRRRVEKLFGWMPPRVGTFTFQTRTVEDHRKGLELWKTMERLSRLTFNPSSSWPPSPRVS